MSPELLGQIVAFAQTHGLWPGVVIFLLVIIYSIVERGGIKIRVDVGDRRRK